MQRGFHNSLAPLCLLWIAGSAAWQLFAPPVLGVANNGDYPKVAGYYSLAPAAGWGPGEYAYFATDYRFSPANLWRSEQLSSEHLFVWPAVKLSRLFYSKTKFSIHALTLVHLLVYLLVAWALLCGLARLPAHFSIPACLLTALALSDTAYVGYLASFYMDCAAMLGTVALAACLLYSVRHPLTAIAFTAAAGVLVFSKSQHAPLAMPLFCFAAFWAWRNRGWARVAWFAAALATGGAGVYMLTSLDRSYRAAPLFSMIFYRIGNSSTDLAADFAELGVGQDYARYRGMHCYSPGSPVEDRAWRDEFLARTNLGKLAIFYVRHPIRAAAFVWEDLGYAAWRHPDPILGIRRAEDGYPPNARAGGMTIWNAARTTLQRLFPASVLILIAASLLVPRLRLAACCGALALAVATLGDTLETARHLYVFHILCDALAVYWLASLGRLMKQNQKAGLNELGGGPVPHHLGPATGAG